MESVCRENHGFGGHNCAGECGTPIGAFGEPGYEEVRHGCLNDEPEGCVDGPDRAIVIHRSYPHSGELQRCNSYRQRVARVNPKPIKTKPTNMFQAPIFGIGYRVPET